MDGRKAGVIADANCTPAVKDTTSEAEGAADESSRNGCRRRGHWRGARAFGYADLEEPENDGGFAGNISHTAQSNTPSAISKSDGAFIAARASPAANPVPRAGQRPLRRAARAVNYAAENGRRSTGEEWEEWPWEALCPEAAPSASPESHVDSACAKVQPPTTHPPSPATPQVIGAGGSGINSTNSNNGNNSLAKQRPRRAAAKALVSTVPQLQAFIRLSGAEVKLAGQISIRSVLFANFFQS